MSGRWRTIETKVCKALGLTPTPLSGSNWKAREDGESDKILAQIKATDGKEITVKLQAILDLAHNSRIARKLPIFVLVFTSEQEPWICIRASQIKRIAKHLEYKG